MNESELESRFRAALLDRDGGLPKLMRLLDDVRARGEEESALRVQLIIAALLQFHDVNLELAESMAEEVARKSPSRVSYSVLAAVKQRLGKMEDAGRSRTLALSFPRNIDEILAAAPGFDTDERRSRLQADEDVCACSCCS